jgi:hypothetical protein
MNVKRFALAASALPVLLTTGNAVAVTLGPLDLAVSNSGDAWILNPSGSSVDFQGYQISSGGGNLNPPGWFSLTDRGETDWEQLSDTDSLLAEAVEIASSAFYTLGPDEAVSLGTPVDASTPLDDLAFLFTVPGEDEAFSGDVVPEPVTLIVLSAAGLSVLRRR